MQRLAFASALLFLIAAPLSAHADVYKYTRADGTVVYTDSLSELPEERRQHYNKELMRREAEQLRIEQEVGREELERQDMERKRQELEAEAQAAADRASRLAQMDAQIRSFRERAEKREAAKAMWQTRWRAAKQQLEKLLNEFRAAQERHGQLAMRADFTLLPGQNKDKQDLEQKLAQLEAAIDGTILELDVRIPEQARKAGVPPGWIRF